MAGRGCTNLLDLAVRRDPLYWIHSLRLLFLGAVNDSRRVNGSDFISLLYIG